MKRRGFIGALLGSVAGLLGVNHSRAVTVTPTSSGLGPRREPVAVFWCQVCNKRKPFAERELGPPPFVCIDCARLATVNESVRWCRVHNSLHYLPKALNGPDLAWAQTYMPNNLWREGCSIYTPRTDWRAVHGTPSREFRHSTSCSNQNAIHPDGAYIGAEECSCRQFVPTRLHERDLPGRILGEWKA